MKIRKLVVLLLAAAMILGVTPAVAADFTDVAADAYYAEAVNWAAEKGITNGKGNGMFAPEDTVTRAEAATFLWRMAGQPEPTKTDTFTDVESDPNNSWYKTAVQWAVEKGITNGTGNGEFSPALPCSRGMILTMLYRMEGNPLDEAMEVVLPEEGEDVTLEDLAYAIIQGMVEALRSEDGLVDVKKGDYYELPIIWAMFNGILDENHVDAEERAAKPAIPCLRGEMVYFLYAASQYEEAAAAAEEANKPLDPIEVGTVSETVVLDKNGVKIKVVGIENDETTGEVFLDLLVENGTDKTLSVDTNRLFVNTFSVSPSTFIPVAEEFWTSYDEVVVPAGESKDFNVCLNDLRDKGIEAVCEMEIQMGVYVRTESEDGYENDVFAVGDPVKIKTSLYQENVAYDLEGTLICEADDLKVLVTKAENDAFMGPRITVYAYNSSDKEVWLELAALKLDGKSCEAFLDLTIPAGKRCAESVYIDLDYENIPVIQEAELTFKTVDPETGETVTTFESVKVTFTK